MQLILLGTCFQLCHVHTEKLDMELYQSQLNEWKMKFLKIFPNILLENSCILCEISIIKIMNLLKNCLTCYEEMLDGIPSKLL